ncbi:MAG: copper homeostasis protein CutC [Muribaculaceae bacterium]|nr:copper homeostasis protein CutC [Muribaculaceae bacterium]
MKTILEICAADIDSVYAAARGGADRVELCCALSEGGLTPSIGLIEEALTVEGIKVNVLIRPRSGDFVYSEAELRVMVRDIETCRQLGVNGVVFGALKPDGDIDMEACRRMAEASEGLHKTFHRAFDMCVDPRKAVRDIQKLGFDRILTSGQEVSAMAGAALIRDLQMEFPGMTFIAAGGVIPSNVSKIVAVSGVREIHASAKTSIESSMTYRRTGVSMGSPDTDEFSRATTSEKTVKAIISKL